MPSSEGRLRRAIAQGERLPKPLLGDLEAANRLNLRTDPGLARAWWVYALHTMRTNIEIEDELIARVMRRYGLRTKRAAVDLALRRLDLEPMSRDEALAMRGTGWEGDLDQLRDRYRGSSPA